MAHRRPGRRRKRRIAPPAKTSAPQPPAAPPVKAIPPQPAATQPAQPAKPRPAKALSPDAALDPLVGQVVGRCRIEERIGEGRTALVYRAQHEALGTTVAIKILLPQAAANPQLVERFETEAQAIAKIDNENVVKIYDVGEQDGRHFLVMELLEGEEVFDLITREGGIDTMDALRITRQAANGLAAAHARGIVHRDVKPQNMILLDDGTVKVVDFGLAAAVAGDKGTTERVGTPHFMAPETCASGVNTAASDIYSLGISLYMLLTGKPPYAGNDVPTILKLHTEARPLRPETKQKKLPTEVAALVRELTAKKADTRPTAPALIEALDNFGGETLQEKTTLGRRHSRRRAMAAAAANRSSAGPLIIAVVLVVGAIVGIVALTANKGDAPSTGPRAEAPAPGPSTPVLPPPPPRATEPPPPPVEPPPALPEAADPEELADRALYEVETWVRRVWRSSADDAAVITRYQNLARRHDGTASAKEAFRRSTEIRKGRMHAHPDKTLADAGALADAKAKWEESLPIVEDLITKHLYFRASGMVPAQMAGERGSFGLEVAFWKRFLTQLLAFKTGLMVYVPKLPEDRRTVETAEGTALVYKLTDQHVKVEIDGKKKDLLWMDVSDQVLGTLARRAFQESPGQYHVATMAFAFAHRLWPIYYEADLDVSFSELTSDESEMVEEYHRRQPARKAGG